MKRAFVTGATGFVGTNLVELLVAQGWQVIALVRPASIAKPRPAHLASPAVTVVGGDVTDAPSVQAAMPETVDAVFHVAASLSLWSGTRALQDRINIEGTRNVVAAALARRARRFIHTSSVGAYGLHDGEITEATPSNALTQSINYVRKKYLAEAEVRQGIERGLPALIINPANIIGPHDQHGWARLFLLVEAGKLPGVPGGRASFAHVTEVARAHLTAVERGTVGDNYLLGGADATYLAMVQEIARLLGRRGPRRAVPKLLLTLAGLAGTVSARFTGREPAVTPEGATMVAARMTCASAKAVRELGYTPRPLSEMLADSHRWLIAAGLLPSGAPTGPTVSAAAG